MAAIGTTNFLKVDTTEENKLKTFFAGQGVGDQADKFETDLDGQRVFCASTRREAVLAMKALEAL